MQVKIIAAFPNPPAPFGFAHHAAVRELAEWAILEVPTNIGFTLAASVGGGGGWTLEAGATFVFGDVHPDRVGELQGFAERLRGHLDQQAVCVLTSPTEFVLIDRHNAAFAVPEPSQSAA